MVIRCTADADNGTPSGTNGTALKADTKTATISVTCNADVTNVDINIWYRENGTDIWVIIADMDDLQGETDDRWSVLLPDIGLIGSRVYVEIDNYADGGSGAVNAYLTERTN